MLGLSNTAAAESPTDVERDVNYLLEYVANSDCTFTRNSKRHDGVAAADHLRQKYELDKRHVHSTELFIDRVASKSSVNGKTYTVNCDGETETTERWLNRALAKYRNQLDPLRNP
jgi:hypothetical protein